MNVLSNPILNLWRILTLLWSCLFQVLHSWRRHNTELDKEHPGSKFLVEDQKFVLLGFVQLSFELLK